MKRTWTAAYAIARGCIVVILMSSATHPLSFSGCLVDGKGCRLLLSCHSWSEEDGEVKIHWKAWNGMIRVGKEYEGLAKIHTLTRGSPPNRPLLGSVGSYWPPGYKKVGQLNAVTRKDRSPVSIPWWTLCPRPRVREQMSLKGYYLRLVCLIIVHWAKKVTRDHIVKALVVFVTDL